MKVASNLIKIHEYLSQYLKPESIAIDMTCGNGHDTLFLAKLCQHVYAFDIQPLAITQSQMLTQDFHNITFICDSHDQVKKYCYQPVDCVIYNLGYLPAGDKTIITQPNTTIASLTAIQDLLKDDGLLIITAYPGHPGGLMEKQAVQQWIIDTSWPYQTLTYDTENSPISYIVQKKP